MQKVVLENGQAHLQFKLPSAKNSNNLENNYVSMKSSKSALLRKTSKNYPNYITQSMHLACI